MLDQALQLPEHQLALLRDACRLVGPQVGGAEQEAEHEVKRERTKVGCAPDAHCICAEVGACKLVIPLKITLRAAHRGQALAHALIGLVEEGDRIEIDIPQRRIHLAVPEAELQTRRAAMDARGEAGWQPAAPRTRIVSKALQAYALMATSAATGAVRDLSQLRRRRAD